MVAKAYSKLTEKAENNVLFIRVPIDTALSVFQYHNLQSAPILTFLPKDEVVGKKVFVCFHCNLQLNSNNDFQVEYPVRAENIASYARSKIHVLVTL